MGTRLASAARAGWLAVKCRRGLSVVQLLRRKRCGAGIILRGAVRRRHRRASIWRPTGTSPHKEAVGNLTSDKSTVKYGQAQYVSARRFMRVGCRSGQTDNGGLFLQHGGPRADRLPGILPATPEPPERPMLSRGSLCHAHFVETQSRSDVPLTQRRATADTDSVSVDLQTRARNRRRLLTRNGSAALPGTRR
jgi:hypothetical protein